MGKAWKQLERDAAKALGGKRHTRSNFGEEAPDVDHELWAVECKYRKRLPVLIANGMEQARRSNPSKIPLLVLKQKQQRGAYVVMEMTDFVDLLGEIGS